VRADLAYAPDVRLDPHSFCDSDQVETESIELDLRVDFSERRLSGRCVLALRASPARSRGGPLDLDTRALEIESVSDGNGKALMYELSAPDPILGSRLRVELPPGSEAVSIRYQTSNEASALQWLEPAQTRARRHPYLFSQCQAIHARSVVPLQDTPRVRVPYTATLDVPSELTSLMAASFVARSAGAPGRARDRWQMTQPIPPYLLALIVGDVASRDLSPRVRVWGEPPDVARAAHEFAGVEAMIAAAEALFGAYDWERFDLVVMPPSFPYGGMENPRLTFLTPTVVAGDRSLVSVVAHELAHSWTGNLVSNASAEHFWLNEGFTVYAERRILEALWGREHSELHAAVGRQELERALADFADHPELTRLRTELTDVDPDLAFSVVPYEKGYLLLRALEEALGRPRWDTFLKRYMAEYRFRALTTEDFLRFIERELPGAVAAVHGDDYLSAPGVPSSAPVPRSQRLEAVLALAPSLPAPELGRAFSPLEWKLYLDGMPRPTPLEVCDELDRRFSLTESQNAEILAAWLLLALESGKLSVLERVEAFLAEVGRMKFLRPLYGALARRPETADRARALFERCREGYHPIARQVVERIVGVEPTG
jgi:leukotriene-A4 hydrolase